METVKQILEHKGINDTEQMEINQNYTIESEKYEDLTIEKIDDDLISVAHYYKKRMDLMRDPEIVFRIEESGDWTPIEYQQDDMGIYQRDLSGLSLNGFVEQWDQNLENQGFVQAA
jgi:hypothetical protein